MEKTLFQKIIDRDIAATIEFEDDKVIVIRDIHPSAPLHLLVIPKKPIPSVNDLQEQDAPLVGHVYLVARDMAQKFGVDKSGYRVVTNVNADGGQTIFHLHFHVLGGEPLGRMNTGTSGHVKKSAPGSGTLLEAGLLLLFAVGLAIGFNMINPARIGWMKKEFERVQAGDELMNKYLDDETETEAEPMTGAAPAPTAAPAPDAPAEKAATPSTTEKTAVTKDAGATPTPPAEEVKKPKFTPEPGAVYEINKAQFTKLLKQPHYLIDARTPEAYAKGFIADAENFFGGEVEGQIPAMLGYLKERDRVILIYCDGGPECELSHHIADALKGFGYGPMFIYMGGWNEWNGK